MSFMPVAELKKTKELWRRLDEDKQLVITRDGRPQAIMVSIQPEELETSLAEIRKALFSASVANIRERALNLPDPEKAIAKAIQQSRKRSAESAAEPEPDAYRP
jgi:PHD/YefM family antitoxin component YafN of YafNO toxin-antitoxin module